MDTCDACLEIEVNEWYGITNCRIKETFDWESERSDWVKEIWFDFPFTYSSS